MFTTTTGWPIARCSEGANARAVRSSEPPDANGTSRVISLTGQLWADAPPAASSPSATVASYLLAMRYP